MSSAPRPDRPCVKLRGHISIRGGMGIGDALYVQSIARHLVQQGQRVQVCSAWPDVFRPLRPDVHVSPFTRLGVDRVAHYSLRKGVPGTTQFEDCCIQAGIKEPVDLRLDWQITDPEFLGGIWQQAAGRQIVLVAMPRPPMGRSDGFGAELAPDWSVYERVVRRNAGRAFLVEVGAGPRLHRLPGIDLDLGNATTVAQLLDLASVAQGFIGTPSFFIPLAESLRKPALILWSRQGLESGQQFIRRITPEKILHGGWCRWAVDDWNDERIEEVFDGVL